MKTFKLFLFFAVAICLFLHLSSCKKDGDQIEEDPQEETLDITKYYIVGKLNSSGTKLPFIYTFDPNAKANSITVGFNTQSSYTFRDGILRMDYGGSAVNTFKITNGQIESFTGVDPIEGYKLLKLPETNQFTGQTFSGGWITPGSNLQFIAKFKFTGSQYGEASIGDPKIDEDYTLIKNVAATSNTGPNGILTFFVVNDGKLEAARQNGSNTVSYGTFAKVN